MERTEARRMPAVHEYLMNLYILMRENRRVVGTRLAERMGVSPPAVTQALRRLQRLGLVERGPNGEVSLTEEGRRRAEAILRRHFLIERLLVDVLGYDWALADREASRLEHALSPELEAFLYERLGRPQTCPHGNPFPGSPEEQARVQAPSLDRVPPGHRVRLLRVVETAEENLELMYFLREHRLLPGTEAAVLHRGEDRLLLAGPAGPVEVPLAYAREVRVAVLGDGP